ncbi:aquaporin-like [Physella acuta]|uniref:aquaporin-like n=1 Tax=Physella acuta TaxID=109671 RepID=UPI0027DD89B7|nr:aquaporin-like [Physella acuta]
MRDHSSKGRSAGKDDRCFSRLIDRELADLKSLALWRGALAEFLGCLFLNMFAIKFGMGKDASLLQVAIGCGFFFAVIITALSTVSGGHVNPAVSIGFLVTGHITFFRCLVYTIFQTSGAITGAAMLQAVLTDTGNLGIIPVSDKASIKQALGCEIFVTFFLTFVIMSLVDAGRKDLQGSKPFIIGLTIAINIFFGEDLSGGAMNPVRNFGPALILGQFKNTWVYWLGPVVGGIAGSLTYDLLFATSPCTLYRMYKRDAVHDQEQTTGEEGQVRQTMLRDKHTDV